jgi:hypothetical protein
MDLQPITSPNSRLTPGVDEQTVTYGSAAPGTLFWRHLFSLLKSRKVIPVVGQDVVIVQGEYGACTLNEHIARRVERSLELQPSPATHRPTLHEVACRYLQATGEREIGNLYWAVNDALAEQQVGVPDSLRKLARIGAFKLYVSTTFDDLLQRAINIERYGGQPRTTVLAYSTNDYDDVSGPIEQLEYPVVYHLLGRPSEVPNTYAVTEEDTLEFVHSLQSDNRRPIKLLDEFSKHSLLLIGSGFSDWLMRFFLRVAKRERLIFARSKTDIVADVRARDDASLADFLKHFSAYTRVFPGDALEFIDGLASRWEEYQATQEKRGEIPVTVEPAAPTPQPVFLSYAHEDHRYAEMLADGLTKANVPVWFDRGGGLNGGMQWENEILTRIRGASLFVPILTKNVLTPERRFFKSEWKEAERVQPTAGPSGVFTVPVCFDDLAPDPATLGYFTSIQWLDARPGQDFAAVVQRIRDLYRRHLLNASAGL